MTWVDPHTWLEGDTATDEIFNAELYGDMLHLLQPPGFMVSSAATYTTTSTSYVPVDSTFTIAIVTGGGKIVTGVSGMLVSPVGQTTRLAIGMDGGTERIIAVSTGGTPTIFSAQIVSSGLSAGQHTPTLRWFTSGGTASLQGVDGSGRVAAPINFWAFER